VLREEKTTMALSRGMALSPTGPASGQSDILWEGTEREKPFPGIDQPRGLLEREHGSRAVVGLSLVSLKEVMHVSSMLPTFSPIGSP
jgi:hypothetical protein